MFKIHFIARAEMQQLDVWYHTSCSLVSPE